jgi:catechol 2,3-dioxygenase-like lactoylglutathione lyase family enzyme
MSDNKAGTPVLTGTEAMLFTADFPRAVEFYTTILGFQVEYTWGEPPYFGLVKRDRARLCLRLIREPVFSGDIREREELLAAVVTLDSAAGINALIEEFRIAGAPFFRGPTVEPWGARDVIVRDPHGNLVLFAGPASDPSAK